jgi:hypothetical protein
MSSSLYMMLFISFTMPSLIDALLHLHRKSPAELYKTRVGHENAHSYQQGSPSYGASLNKTGII